MSDPSDILKRYWGYPAFRPLQEEIIRSVLEGNHTLALLPTGGGKSICFQVPALCLEGICIVISPLIALMKDQVEQLRKRGIKAAALFSGMSRKEIDITLDNCIYGNIKFLYVSPERIKTDLFLERAKRMKIALLAIDEAHCISQWGYDFRPPYLEISRFIEAIGISHIIALTASATREVKQDIVEKLKMKDVRTFQKSFARYNLSYSVFELENKEQKMLEILRSVPGTGIVYVRSRKRTQKIAEILRRYNIQADYYHAGLTGEERTTKQEAWINNRVRVIVATNAFGMGIDKPDVRTVIHYDLPDSLEAYYQEAGRAGRDEKKAYTVVLYHATDLEDLQTRAEKASVTVDFMKRVYQALANYYKLAVGSNAFSSFDFDYQAFTSNFNLPPIETFHALKKLEDEGLIQLNEAFNESSRVIFLQSPEETYKFQVAHESLDRVIKTILRLYGGEIYSNYITIREQDIAALLKDTKAYVVKSLQYLHKLELIEYQYASGKPHITFLTHRYDASNLPVDSEQIAWRRKVTLEKAGTVADYAKNRTMCRTRTIQLYFDEQTDRDCGVCDVCLEKKKKQEKLPLKELEAILKEKSMRFEDLRAHVPAPESALLEGLRILLDEEKISLDAKEQFSWRGRK